MYNLYFERQLTKVIKKGPIKNKCTYMKVDYRYYRHSNKPEVNRGRHFLEGQTEVCSKKVKFEQIFKRMTDYDCWRTGCTNRARIQARCP